MEADVATVMAAWVRLGRTELACVMLPSVLVSLSPQMPEGRRGDPAAAADPYIPPSQLLLLVSSTSGAHVASEALCPPPALLPPNLAEGDAMVVFVGGL